VLLPGTEAEGIADAMIEAQKIKRLPHNTAHRFSVTMQTKKSFTYGVVVPCRHKLCRDQWNATAGFHEMAIDTSSSWGMVTLDIFPGIARRLTTMHGGSATASGCEATPNKRGMLSRKYYFILT
jgi:hypothetical protein